ncbi:SET domain-containing protein [Singulisphaera acidiphila]|uniref:SET domain-containing protein n=1 Tax=Singulisphaera acidiphila (strain ATCC BAA-1392 / DSM 18658 / VKM B-2454 / MOB10) TaxID=886293 RepID=L0DHS4_SINAD|nr:SET domain-containing protein [Singulisphaera acidiphila]AGA28817.1 SET domain-containing protein [Singulisphaera acidiphila DSM 18658]
MVLEHSDAIEVRRSPGRGRGVFARRLIREGEVIERVPVLVVPIDELKQGSAWTSLGHYCFLWSKDTVALALGYGSLYNHSFRPNARYDDRGQRTKVFTSLRDIEPGEEITVNYNGDPDDDSAVGFAVVEAKGDGDQPGRSPKTARKKQP